MSYEVVIPKIGDNIKSAEVISFKVAVGDVVQKDQPLIELETEKAVFELPSPEAGVVKQILVKIADVVEVGQQVMLLELKGDKEKTTPPFHHTVSEVSETMPESKKISSAFRQDASVNASPLVRRIARELGVVLKNLSTGDGKRITVEQVKQAFIKAHPSASKQVLLPDFSKWGSIERQAMSTVRKTTAEKMSQSWQEIPHVTQCDLADITDLEKLRIRYAAHFKSSGGHLSWTVLLLKTLASALKVFPQMNASLDLDRHEIIMKQYIHLGIAVDTSRGLLVPVLKNVDQKNILEISSELQALTQKARDKKLSLEEMQGATFTLTNLGNIGGSFFTPIIHWPEVAILGVGRARVEAVQIDGAWQPRQMLPLSLSYDHRVIDGADGARFLQWIKEALQDPFLITI
ncbi:MAG: 2-oxo acid dehydrogenase subunit E2 [Deltaproteobacteria bacterium]|nr:2-oxo acid dehydrogenase subunit E2 [Deltaproteobacteria bacterium]